MLVTIYQIKDMMNCKYGFRDWESAKDDFSLNDYKNVYSYFVERDSRVATEKEKLGILNEAFKKFNCDRPEDFTGHSLSVSDLVMLGTDIYYCDSFGWELVR